MRMVYHLSFIPPHPVFGQTVNPISIRGQIMPTTVLRSHQDKQIIESKLVQTRTIFSNSEVLSIDNLFLFELDSKLLKVDDAIE